MTTGSDSSSRLVDRLGLSDHTEPLEPHLERLEATARSTWDRFERVGKRHPRACPPRLSLPPSFAEVLEAALALERAEPDGDSAARRERLLAHYLDWMPALRVEQLTTSEAPNAFLFHEPFRWECLPRLTSGLERLFALLDEAEVSAVEALGSASPVDFQARYATLADLYADTYFGRFMPFLYGFPADLAAYRRELDAEDDPWDVFDRRIAAPVLHELMHFRPERQALFPLYLDECLAGYLGVHVFPEFAYPRPGQNNALFASPWFAQVGQALVRALGLRAVVRAQSGAEPWESALPKGLWAASERLGWEQYRSHREPHFLTREPRPGPWMKLFFLAAAGELPAEPTLESLDAIAFADIPCGEVTDLDGLLLRHGLLAMCLHNALDQGSYRVSLVAPGAAITIDLSECRLSRPSRPDSVDTAPPSYLLPPAVAARLRTSGVRELVLDLSDPAAIPAVVEALLQGETAHAGEDYTLTRR